MRGSRGNLKYRDGQHPTQRLKEGYSLEAEDGLASDMRLFANELRMLVRLLLFIHKSVLVVLSIARRGRSRTFFAGRPRWVADPEVVRCAGCCSHPGWRAGLQIPIAAAVSRAGPVSW